MNSSSFFHFFTHLEAAHRQFRVFAPVVANEGEPAGMVRRIFILGQIYPVDGPERLEEFLQVCLFRVFTDV